MKIPGHFSATINTASRLIAEASFRNTPWNPAHLDRTTAKTPSASINPDIVIGARVHHAKFGDGIVDEIDGEKVEVKFDTTGQKRVLASFITPI